MGLLSASSPAAHHLVAPLEVHDVLHVHPLRQELVRDLELVLVFARLVLDRIDRKGGAGHGLESKKGGRRSTRRSRSHTFLGRPLGGGARAAGGVRGVV